MRKYLDHKTALAIQGKGDPLTEQETLAYEIAANALRRAKQKDIL